MARVAIIDMGTNTFHLMVAEVNGKDWTPLIREHKAVKLGKAGINESIIAPDAFRRAIDTMKGFASIIAKHKPLSTFAFGTSAIRNASNGAVLAMKIKESTGIDIRVISGDEEAELITEGVRAALDLGNEKNLIMDIGAGSVEFIIADSREVFWQKSIEIGGQRLLEKFQKHDPILDVEIAALDSYLDSELVSLLSAIKHFSPTILIGSSGTFDTLSEIYCHRSNLRYDGELPETPLSVDFIEEIYQELVTKDRSARMQIQGMIELRVEMIVVATCLIRHILRKHHFEGVRVSTYSLKEGALARAAKGHLV